MQTALGPRARLGVVSILSGGARLPRHPPSLCPGAQAPPSPTPMPRSLLDCDPR